MVQYVPPPQDLSKLNPIQRYMQKGSLDWSDWARLIALVAAYWFLRPYIQNFARRLSGEEVAQGEAEQDAYKERREAAAVSANEIRSGKKVEEGKTLAQLLDEGVDGFDNSAKASGAATANTGANDAEVKSRKPKKKGVSFAPEKTSIEKTMDWEDESEFDPRRKPVEGEEGVSEAGDIKAWMEKWTS